MNSNNECEREKIVKLVRKWGGSTVDAALDEASLYFSHPEVEGVIPYRQASGCAVIFGDPVCPEGHLSTLVTAFHEFCDQNRMSAIYLIVTDAFKRWAVENLQVASIEFGQELVINPMEDDPQAGHQGALLRKKVRRAAKEGIAIHEYVPHDAALEQRMDDAVHAWLDARLGPQVFIAKINLFKDAFGRRWFYAAINETIVGIALLNRLEARRGWVLTQIVLAPDAPVGTSEALVVATVSALAREGCLHLSFGAVPGQKLGDIHGLNRFSSWLIYRFFNVARRLFKLDNKKVFWDKFQPRYESSHVLFVKKSVKIKNIVGLIRALNMSL